MRGSPSLTGEVAHDVSREQAEALIESGPLRHDELERFDQSMRDTFDPLER